jgi:hypothetical protein
MAKYRFTGRYESASVELTGAPLPGETFLRRESGEPVAGSGVHVTTERIHHGRQFHADAGDVRELTDEQAAYIERDAPGIVERVKEQRDGAVGTTQAKGK